MATTAGRPVTCTGTALYGSADAGPSSPTPLSPQAQTEPSVRKAYPPTSATAMEVTEAKPLTCTGTLLWVVELFPSSPVLLSPHAQTVPSLRRASAELRPAPTAVAAASPATRTGTVLGVV